MKNWKLSLAAITVVLSGQTQAALHDRGNGMIYDDVLNVTWLQDLNYAQTSGYDADGLMTWAEAMTWTSQLNYQGFTTWRLPSAGVYPYDVEPAEFRHMFFTNLGNDGAGTGVNCYPSCFTNTSFIDGTTGLTVYLTNINNNWYWLLEADDADPVNYKKAFSTGDGIQDVSYNNTGLCMASFRR